MKVKWVFDPETVTGECNSCVFWKTGPHRCTKPEEMESCVRDSRIGRFRSGIYVEDKETT